MVHIGTSELIHMQIKRIEKEIRDTPYHKATEHHIGKLRARLSRLKEKLQESQTKKSGGGLRLGGASGSERGYAVKKQGDATVILIGPPSAGKSTLLNKFTNARSKVAPYAFTTVSVIPGMMDYKNAKIQILDVPGLIEGAEEGKGRGREVLSVTRGADLAIIITDFERIDALERISKTLEKNGIRLNQERPKVIVDKKLQGGVLIRSNIKQYFSKDTVKSIASEMGIKNAEITINEKLDIDRLIDAFSRNRVYLPSISVINKSDLLTSTIKNHKLLITNHQSPHALFISAETGLGLDTLKETVWEKLKFITVYLVRPNEEPSNNNPIIVKRGGTLRDIAEEIGTDFAENKKRAKIWGASAKFPGQEVPLSTIALDGMQVRFV
jgi:uncharacterized protein